MPQLAMPIINIAPPVLLQKRAAKVTESVRAHSYFLSSEVITENLSILVANISAVNRPLPLYMLSKSVVCTLDSVNKLCLERKNVFYSM